MANPFFTRRHIADGEPRRRANGRTLTASAMRINIGDRTEVTRLTKIKQTWQGEAWAYRRNVGELRYADAYLSNSCMRLRLHPAVYTPGDAAPAELTIHNATELAIPSDLVQAAHDALHRLASGGPTALAQIQKKLTSNFEIAGECYLVCQIDPVTRLENWSIKSVSELYIQRDGSIYLAEHPGMTNVSDMALLDPASSTVERLWWPDPQWGMMADSPVRAVLDTLEELLLLSRDVRATARSRIANNGMLFIPESMTVLGAEPETEDDEADPFTALLMNAAQTAMSSEGSAAAVVPLVIRGPDAAGGLIKHIMFDRPQNKFNIQQRGELIGRLATGLDLPAEVLTGKADLNHWSSWQIDDDAFRHHIEPIAIVEVDALTVGYLWPQLDAMNRWDPALVRRVVLWYDATELVTHPDRAVDAKDDFDRGAIGREALRRYTGMTDADAPGELDAMLYILEHARGVDPSLLSVLLRQVAKTITIPDLQPKAVDVQVDPTTGDPLPVAPIAAPPPPTPDVTPGPPAAAARAAVQTLMWRRVAAARALVAATAKPKVKTNANASRKLLDIDRDLRIRIQTAANAAIKNILEKAGAKVVSKARTAGGASVRDAIKDVPKALIAATLGPRLVASLGLTEKELTDNAFAELEKQWDAWVTDGQEQALRTAARIAGVDVNAAYAQLAGTFKDDADEGWSWLVKQLHSSVSKWLTTAPTEEIEVDTTDFISTGLVRAALSLAGGFGSDAQSQGLSDDGTPVNPDEHLGGIGGGDTVTGFMDDNGVVQNGYTWVHGGTDRPFPPHDDLDGTQFTDFTDDALANTTGFPDGAYYYPGDHDGCGCDAYVEWASADSTDNSAGSTDEEAA